jgi:hypothetical protein
MLMHPLGSSRKGGKKGKSRKTIKGCKSKKGGWQVKSKSRTRRRRRHSKVKN